jgi:peptide/nickel transport system permease protein
MTTETLPTPGVAPAKKAKTTSTFARVARYSVVRLLTLMITVTIGVYLTILIVNMGGYMDKIMRGEIRDDAVNSLRYNATFQRLPQDQKDAFVAKIIANREKALGLNQPFIVRSFKYLGNALTLNLGRAQHMQSDHGSNQVRNILLERLPATLLLAGTAELIIFFGSVFFALGLSRKYGSFMDKLVIGLSPTSAAPPWFYGIFLILIFAAVLHVMPFGGLVDSPPPANKFEYGLSVLKHVTLPAAAVIMSAIFLSIYNWRTYFLIYSSEDYVDMAKAKGLSSRDVERRYILRPTLPNIITSFALLAITLWTGFIITLTSHQ